MIAVFQSHTYSRTKALFDDFSRSFSDADLVVITDIYASARENEDQRVSGKKLTEAVKIHHPKTVFCSGKDEVVEYLSREAKKGDVILTMGAGDIFLWHGSIVKALKAPRG